MALANLIGFWFSANDGGTPGTAGSGTKGPVSALKVKQAFDAPDNFVRMDLTAPPAATAGQAFFIPVGSTPTGAWAGQDGSIAYSTDGTAWEFLTPVSGETYGNADDGLAYHWNGTDMVPLLGGTFDILFDTTPIISAAELAALTPAEYALVELANGEVRKIQSCDLAGIWIAEAELT